MHSSLIRMQIRARYRPGLLGAILCAGIVLGYCIGCTAPHKAGPVSRSAKRSIPDITFENLTPPYLDYEYFQDSRERPFQLNVETFSPINAWWLAEAAALAYADESFATARFRLAGLPEVRFFSKLSTQCYVASNTEFAIIAFRGSEVWKKRERLEADAIFADFVTNLNVWPADFGQAGKVHRGFKAALDQVWPELIAHIGKLEEKGCAIWITGHSLGGALATLCAYRHDGAKGVYTFGAPRVGDADFAKNNKAKIYRVVNNDDFVPRLPALGFFEHVGELKFIDGGGTIHDAALDSQDDLHTGAAHGMNDPGPTGTNRSFVPPALRDHVPLLYAIHMWNALIDSR